MYFTKLTCTLYHSEIISQMKNYETNNNVKKDIENLIRCLVFFSIGYLDHN
jgi:hypothetical protein